jgi:putative membrane protein
MASTAVPAITTATERVKPNFRRRPLLQWLVAWYGTFWVWMAVAPLDRRDWLLENLLVFVLVGVLATTYRRFPLSDMSYLLITAMLTLHAIGAHYTYAKTPLGFWMENWFGFRRNQFDRLVHFCFGLLMAYPIREVFLRVAHTRGFWSYYLPLDVTLAFSAFYEIMESWVAMIVAAGLGDTWLGTQGDVWDAQKDMTAALVGALVCMGLTAWLHRVLEKGERIKSPLKPALS